MPVPAPSGRQSLLSYGDQQAVVVEIGGGLRTYTVKGVGVIDGYAETEVCTGARGQPLIPWPNRLDGGHFDFDGTTRQFPINEIPAGNAIHGLTSWVPWRRAGSGTDHVTMANTLHPQPGWDWTVDLTITYALGPNGLRVTTTAVNLSPTRCPFGAGFHPYFRPPSGRAENVVLSLPASSYDVVNDRNIPVARATVDDTSWDFRQPRRIGDLAINVGYTDIQRDADGVATFTAAEAGTDWHVAVKFERGWDWAVVYTGDTLESGARQSVAIEPMTGPANLMQTGENRLVLEPHQAWEASWSIVPGWI